MKNNDYKSNNQQNTNNSGNDFQPREDGMLSAKFAESYEDMHDLVEGDFRGFSSRKEMILDSLQRYWENCKVMMMSSLNHMRSPVTIVVMIFLIATYILLGWAGSVEFQFYNVDVVQQITTNLDIIVNAVLGYFFGPVTCAIGVALCTTVRMIVKISRFYSIYFICATVAGFLHGWILYRHRNMWFGTRFRGFFADLLSKVAFTRFMVSAFINVLLMAVLYMIMYGVPIESYLMLYSKSGVPLTSYYEFFSVFLISLLFEILIVYLALAFITFILSKAFPSQVAESQLIIGENGEIINPEDDYQ